MSTWISSRLTRPRPLGLGPHAPRGARRRRRDRPGFRGAHGEGGFVPPHTEDNGESFYVLEGVFEIEADGEAHRCEVGDFLVIAPGVLHSLRNVGPGWGRLLIKTSPGSGHLRFFETLGEPIEPGADPTPLAAPPEFAPIEAVGRECGLYFVAPAEG
jgi:mannose-6-phosphate isomerase-like protein (cupin superfamily)